jgi:hypothetical protein
LTSLRGLEHLEPLLRSVDVRAFGWHADDGSNDDIRAWDRLYVPRLCLVIPAPESA